jgi:molecular chaperone DnaJ
MNRIEACKILGVSDTASQEEIKKEFRKQAKIYHPDNKDTGNETKFKELNQAFQLLESGKASDEYEPPASSWGNVNIGGFGINIGDILGDIAGFANPFASYRPQQIVEDVKLSITIPFRDAILGCQVPIKYNRNFKCLSCNGQGRFPIDNCSKCHGTGRVETKKGNTIFSSTCSQCKGKVQYQACATCRSTGASQVEAEGSINIEAGISDGAILRLRGHGNFTGTSMFGDNYSDALITVKVSAADGLTMEGQDVISRLTITLLEALEGCTKQIPTIDGVRDIIVSPNIRHNEEVVVPALGVARKGKQRVIVSVEYPADVKSLITLLKE